MSGKPQNEGKLDRESLDEVKLQTKLDTYEEKFRELREWWAEIDSPLGCSLAQQGKGYIKNNIRYLIEYVEILQAQLYMIESAHMKANIRRIG